MPQFEYKAKSSKGEALQGIVEGSDIRATRTGLMQQGLFVVSIRERKAKVGGGNPFVRYIINPIFGGASTHDMAIFYRQFATMV
jgi:type II secretory pathway component PulF